MKIFLSHRSRDKSLVREFKDLLPSFLSTWIDEESLLWGSTFPTELKSTIQSGIDFLIIFLDGDALKAKWVMQELQWAVEREKELKRTFVLPILIDEVPSTELPIALSERHYLRLTDFSRSAVEDLAKRASLGLFQLIVESYSAIQLSAPIRKSLLEIRDELNGGQAKLLGILVQDGIGGNEMTQREIERISGHSHASGELFYRLEALIKDGFISKRRIAADGQFSYSLSEEFRSQLN